MVKLKYLIISLHELKKSNFKVIDLKIPKTDEFIAILNCQKKNHCDIFLRPCSAEIIFLVSFLTLITMFMPCYLIVKKKENCDILISFHLDLINI